MIIAFYSAASSTGKDTCADVAARYISGRYERETFRDAFAWDGKCVLADALGCPWDWPREKKVAYIDALKLYGKVRATIDDPERHYPKHGDVGGRDFIIGALGSPGKGNGIRGLQEDFWTQQVIKRDQQRAGTHGYTLVSDMRFVEEAVAVNRAAGYIIEVQRPDAHVFNEQRLPAGLINDVILNDGTLPDLQERAQAAITRAMVELLGPA